MDTLGDFLLALSVLITLAAMGVSTVIAFGLMAAMGFITEMSFRRVFFLSFGIAMLPSLLLGGILIGVLQDEGVQSDLSVELREVLPVTEGLEGEASDDGPLLDQAEQELRDGEITSQEFERRIEELLPGTDVQVDEDGFRITTEDGDTSVQIGSSEGQ